MSQSAAPRQRFRPHLAYKHSGVEWLGEIPVHWDVRRLKFLLAEPLKYGANEAAELDDPDLPRYVRITDIDESDGLREETFKSLPLKVAEKYLLREGDLLFARSGATAGKTFLYRRSWGSCAYAGYLIRARLDTTRAVPEFVRYFTASISYWQWLSAAFIQATIQNVSAEKYDSLVISQPPHQEQRAIVAFLDRETARLDALVVKKERLIELLGEQRTALITSAVTTGLDPTVPMKDSGVEWLGEIPVHWEVKRLRHLVARIEQGWSPECENREADDDEWGVLKAGCVNRGIFLESEHKALPAALLPIASLEISEGDLLMSRASGSRELVGSVAVVPKCRPRLLLCDKVFRLHPRVERADRYFLAYAMNSTIARSQIEVVLSGGSGLANNIAQEVVKDLLFAQPRLPEQRAIVAVLDRETARIDALAAKVREAIKRLKELRTALISAAVTGKIDVREVVA